MKQNCVYFPHGVNDAVQTELKISQGGANLKPTYLDWSLSLNLIVILAYGVIEAFP